MQLAPRLSGFLVLLLACSDSMPDNDAAVDAGFSAGDASVSGSDAGAPTVSDGGTSTDASALPPCDADIVTRFEGVVQAAGGGVPTDTKVQLCLRGPGAARALCLRPQDTDTQGAFSVSVPDIATCVSQATMRVFSVGQDVATTYCIADTAGSSGDLTISKPVQMFATDRATVLPDLGANTTTPRTVRFADGLEIDVIPSDLLSEDGAYERLGARRYPTSTELCFVDNPAELSAIYAFSPEATIFGEGFSFRIPNGTAKGAGAEVDLYIVGGLGCVDGDMEEIPEAEWRHFGTGVVSQDGATIVSVGDDRLRCMTWLGVGN